MRKIMWLAKIIHLLHIGEELQASYELKYQFVSLVVSTSWSIEDSNARDIWSSLKGNKQIQKLDLREQKNPIKSNLGMSKIQFLEVASPFWGHQIHYWG